MLPLNERSSPVTPATPEAPSRSGLLGHALEGVGAALVNGLRDLRHFAAEHVADPRAERAEEAHRIDAVADDEFAGAILFQREAIDFVA